MTEPTDPQVPEPEEAPASGFATGKVRAVAAEGMEAEMQALLDKAEEEADLTYGDIVWTQFKKNRVAYWALWGLGTLIALAVFAPMIASTRPLWWSLGEESGSPWLASLFDTNFFENPLDLFFNLGMVLGLPLLLGWLFRVRVLSRSNMKKRPRRRRMLREFQVTTVIFMTTYLILFFSLEGSTYRQYQDEELKALLEGRAITAIYPPIRIAARTTGFSSLEKPRSSTEVRLTGSGTRLLKDESADPALLALLQTLQDAGGGIDISTLETTPAVLAQAQRRILVKVDPPHVLGVDQSTRDVAVRLLYGTRVSLSIGVIAVSIYVTIGIILGALAGFFGGRVDLAIQRIIEVTMALPTFFVIITLAAFLEEPSIFHIMLIIGLVRWTGVARLTRGEFLRLRNQEFVLAATALGYPQRRIIFEHILPNAVAPVLVSATFGVASAILLEATLSFLGLGDLSAPSWGQTLREGYGSGSWHLILAPGFAIFVTVSLLNLVGEGLRDALDPKLRK